MKRRWLVLCLLWLFVARFPVDAAASDAVILAIQSSIQEGDIDAAQRAIAVALKNDPRDGGVYNLRGIVEAKRGEFKAAEVDFTRAVQLRPDLAGAYLNLGRACEMLSVTEPEAINRAIAQYRRLLKLRPESNTVRLQLSKLLERRGEYATSLKELNGLPGSDRRGALAISLRCADLTGVGRSREAETTALSLRGSSGLDEQVIDTVLPALVKNKADPIAILLLELVDQRRQLSYENRLQLSDAYARCGRLPDARRTLEKIVSDDPTNAAPLLQLARIAEKQNDLNGALEYLAHARDLNPNYAPVHFFFGVVCIELDLPLEAKKSLQKALDLDPENPAYNYARGSVELQGRAGWQAIPYFKKFVAAQPNDPRGHFALGAAEFASQDYELAAQEMTSVANDTETRAGAEYFLGRIAKAESDWSKASAHFQNSIEADPDYAESYAELGLAKMHLNDLAGARRDLDRALELSPDNYIANGNLLAYFQRTRNPLAKTQEEKLHALDLKRSEKQELMVRTIKIRRYTN
ncbi:MAG: tetratricopeptide repeat protein [Acidobacteriota bacterium]|nr:tetratricopeptide repeat protein [Acidobacteriota bacterium]